MATLTSCSGGILPLLPDDALFYARGRRMEEAGRLSVTGLRSLIDAGELSAGRVVEGASERARTLGPLLNAFTEVLDEPVRQGPLRGVPVAVKDAFVDGGRAPTMGSRVRARGSTGTAELLRRLRGAGASITGYTNLHEWAIGTTSAITATGPIRNPWDRSRIAGGSSGGSAAAVAAGIVPAAIGTDAGGSVRIPAACCGVVGLKPTFGTITLDGEAAGSTQVNHAGVITRTVADARVLFETLAERRSASVELSSLTLGRPATFFFDDVQPQVEAVVERALSLVSTRLSGLRAVDVTGVENASNFVSRAFLGRVARIVGADIDARPGDFDPWTLRSLRRGLTLEVDVDLEPHRAIWERAFEACDVLVAPTLPALPPRVDDEKISLPSGPAVADLAMFALNAPMNTGGVPALAVPCGRVDGMPVSITFVAPWGQENLLFAVGEALEDLLDGAYANRVATID